jgi:hypothetical protein
MNMILAGIWLLVMLVAPRTERTCRIWMTLPVHSGNMSQLYRGFSWISMVANLAGATVVAPI